MIQVEINWQPNQQVSICGSRHRHHLMFNLFNGIFWRFAHYSNTKFWTSLYSIPICVWGCFACFRVYPYYCCRFQLEKIDFHLWLCAFLWELGYFLCDPVLLQIMGCYFNITMRNIWCDCCLTKSFVGYPIFTSKWSLSISIADIVICLDGMPN